MPPLDGLSEAQGGTVSPTKCAASLLQHGLERALALQRRKLIPATDRLSSKNSIWHGRAARELAKYLLYLAIALLPTTV